MDHHDHHDHRAAATKPADHDHHDHRAAATKPEIRAMLRQSGLRPTRQRMALAELLFARGNRHISAESLHEEATLERVPVSLATIYNTLHQFTEAKLLREVAVDGSKTYFDTNTEDHHHFFVEDDNQVLDIPVGEMGVGKMPEPPAGYEISRVDVVVRLRRIRHS
jgi:Fur family iron response transcriptional regulator